MLRAGLTTLVLAWASAPLQVLRAEPQAAPLPIEALFGQEAPLPPALSPDGRWVASVIAAPNPDAAHDGSGDMFKALRKRLQVVDTRTGSATRIGPTNREVSNPVWSPDGVQLVFQVDTDDRARLWLWSASTGKIRPLAEVVPRNYAPARWTPDGRRIVIAVLPEGMTNETIRQRWGKVANASASDSAYPLDANTRGARVAVYRAGRQRPPNETVQDYAHNNLDYLADLALIEVETGRAQRLVSGFRPVGYRVSPDGRYVSFTHAAGQQDGSGYRNLYDLLVAPAEGGGTPRVLVTSVLQAGIRMEAVWSPDSGSLAFCDSGPATQYDCYVTDVERAKTRKVAAPSRALNEKRWAAPLWDISGDSFYLLSAGSLSQVRAADLTVEPLAVPDGKQVLQVLTRRDSGVAASDGGRTLVVHTRDQASKAEGFYALDLKTRGTRKLREAAEHVSSFSVDVSVDARTVVYAAQRADAPEQLWASDLGFRSTRQLTHLNPQLRDYRMGQSRLVSWRSPQGRELNGALLLPADYQPDRRYPLIVYLYGDKKLSNNVNVFGVEDAAWTPYENMQLLATRGYAVLRPDTETRIGTPMHDIAATLLPAVDKLIEEGVADPGRLGIMGRSYGGYSVLSVLVQTGRFKAAIEVCGMASLPGVFSEMTPAGTTSTISWAEESQGKMGGTLWEHRERYIENSPLFYFDRVTTPLLIVHGTEDTRVLVHNGDEIFQALRRLGNEVEYAKYLGEPHVIFGRANGIDYANRMIAWFDQRLKAGAEPRR